MSTITITSNGNGVARYEFTVDGDLEPGPEFEDTIDGQTASGRVGPERGVDDFEFTGEITDWSLDHPDRVTITIDGEEVDSETLDPIGEPEPEPEPEPVDLDDFSDDELIAELRDRGVSVVLTDYSDDELVAELVEREYQLVPVTVDLDEGPLSLSILVREVG